MAGDSLTPSSPTLDREHQALFVTDWGGGFGALDVLREGLDRPVVQRVRSHRAPVITDILRHSPVAFHRVVAAMILSAWGETEGLRTVIEWCRHPAGSPASEQMETYDRFSMAYNGYELLAHGLGAAVPIPAAAALHRDAVRALIGVVPRRYVGRRLADAVESVATDWPELSDTVAASTAACLEQLGRLDGRVDDLIDLAFQTGVLIAIQARYADQAGVASLRQFLAIGAGERAEREAIYGLRHNPTPVVRRVLGELAAGTGPRAEVAAQTLIACERPYRRPVDDPGAAGPLL